jgi:hypothetical protein
MARPDKETVEQLRAHIQRCGTLRATAEDLGFPLSYAAIFSNLMKEQEGLVSRAKENEIRHRLNLFPLGTTYIHQVPTKKLGDLIRWARYPGR